MSKKQITVKVETYLTIEMEIPEASDHEGFSMEEEIETLIENMDYSFTADPDYLGEIVETEIIGHEIELITDINEED